MSLQTTLILSGATLVIVGIMTWAIFDAGRNAEKNAATKAALYDQVESGKKSYSVGLDIINGNNKFEEKTHAIDTERTALPPAPLPNADRLRLRNARNQAGITARHSVR